MTQANQADFFGGGYDTLSNPSGQVGADPADQPNPANPGGISDNELMRRQRALSDPTYAAQRGAQQSTAPTDALGDRYSAYPAGTPTGQVQRDSNGNVYQVVADSPAQRDAYNANINTVAKSPYSNNPILTPGAPASTSATTPGVAGAGAPGAAQALAGTNANANALEDKSADATQSIVDRYGNIKYDTSQSDQSRQEQADAFGMNTQLYDTLMKYDPAQEAKRMANASMNNELAISRSAVGGAGARQEAMFNALGQAPAIQAQAATDARAQQMQNYQQALGAAGQAGQIATGTRSTDITDAQNQVQAGVQVAQGIANAIGQDLNIDAGTASMLAQVQTAMVNSGIQWSALSETERENKFMDLLKSEGLDQSYAEFEQSRQLSTKDVLGALTSLGGEAVSGGFKIAAANAGKP